MTLSCSLIYSQIRVSFVTSIVCRLQLSQEGFRAPSQVRDCHAVLNPLLAIIANFFVSHKILSQVSHSSRSSQEYYSSDLVRNFSQC